MPNRGRKSVLARLVLAASVLPLLGATQHGPSVIVDFEVLESLPRGGDRSLAPQIKPLSLVRPAKKTDLFRVALSNPPTWPDAVPLAFQVEEHLSHGLDLEVFEGSLRDIMEPPSAALPSAWNKAPYEPPSEPKPVEQQVASLPPDGVSGSVSTRVPKERDVALVQPSKRPPLPTKPRPEQPRSVARPRSGGPPPLVAWNEHSPLGAVRFTSGGVDVMDIDRASLPRLDALAEQFRSSGRRILLKAFAGRAGDKSHEAHRLALRRGLAVRRYLISRGVPSTKIDVRAVGGATDGGYLDRVDVVAAAS